MARPRRVARLFDVALIACFSAFLLAPTLDHFARPAERRSVTREKRKPSVLPARPTSLEALSAFPARFDGWFADRLGGRDVLLRAHQALLLHVFGSEPSPTMVVGRHGWLFVGAEETMPIGRGVRPVPGDHLARWQRAIESRRDWLRARGIRHVFAVAPNKEAVYPDYLPAREVALGPTHLDQLGAWLSRHSDVEFLDLRAALREEATHDATGDHAYHPLGSHFTWRGGWAATNAILARIRPLPAASIELPREWFRVEALPESAGDSFGDSMYIGDLLDQSVFAFTQTREVRAQFTWDHLEGSVTGHSDIADPSLPRVVLVHDSFGPWIVPFLAQRCARLATFHGYALPRRMIEEEKPDVVIEMYTERALRGELPPLPVEIEEIDARLFATGAPLWGPLDLGRTPPEVRFQGGIVGEPRDGELAFVLQRVDGGIVLPDCRPPPETDLALHLDLTVPAPTVLALGYQRADAPTFSRARMAEFGLHAGRNDVYLRLRVPGLAGPILLRSGGPLGNYVLRALEARATR